MESMTSLNCCLSNSIYLESDLGVEGGTFLFDVSQDLATFTGGHVDMLSSDYLPTMLELKLLDDGDFLRAWGGISSLQRAIAIGNHADMVVWDPYVEFDLDDGHPVYLKHSGISASLGTKLSGRVSATFVRGNLVSKRGSMRRSDSGKIIKNLD
ncbi:unnamed protein product [Prunus armeniaca]